MTAVSGGLDPAVAAVRRAVRLALGDVEAGQRVLVACSGGTDSTALAAGTAFEAATAGWLVGAIVIDHGWRDDSAHTGAAVAGRLRTLDAFGAPDPVEVVRVEVGVTGGPEAAARRARYAALDDAADRYDAVVLLGHTRDDQAETVLLGLARGSGTRSLGGMRPVIGRYRRPLLRLSREQTHQACRALGLPTWDDPANENRRFARVRVRRSVLPVVEAELGPGVAAALARTADLATADADALDELAADLLGAAAGTQGSLDVAMLASAHVALRSRVLRTAALAAGSPPGELFAVHIEALDALVVGWRGQRGVDLPGHLTATREGAILRFDGPGRRVAGRPPPRDPHPAH